MKPIRIKLAEGRWCVFVEHPPTGRPSLPGLSKANLWCARRNVKEGRL